MNTSLIRKIAESQKEVIDEKKLEKARKLCKEVEALCKKYNMSFFFVTEGASITRNDGNDAVRNAREAQVKWEKENSFTENHVDATHVAGFAPAVNYFVNKVSIVFDNYYAYSARDVVEVTKEDGSVVKEAKFRHKGFYKYD